MKYKVEVLADNSGHWASNALSFDSVDSAESYARDLWARWTAVKAWRVVDTENHETKAESAPLSVADPKTLPTK